MSLLEPAVWSGKAKLGAWTAPEGGTAPVVEPATGKTLETIGVAGPGDVAAAARRADAARRAWAQTPYTERAAVLRRAGDLLLQYTDDIGWWLIREAGGIPGKAAFEVSLAAQNCYEAATLASRPLGEVLPTAEQRLSMTRRVPAGVVGVIAPFNFPLVLAVRSVAPALALGNAVLLKPDLRTAVAGGVALVRIFEEAGLPEGVLGLLPGGASTDFLTEEHLDLPMDFNELQKGGSRLGTGTMIVLDNRTCPVGMVWNLTHFFARESCGWCTPCWSGLNWAERILSAMEDGRGQPGDLEKLSAQTKFWAPGNTFCALAPGAAEPLQSALIHFRDDFERHIREKRCPWK